MNVPVHRQRNTVVLLTKPKQTLHHLCLVSVLEKMKAFCLFGRAKLTLNTAPPSLVVKVIYLSLYDTTQEGRNYNCYFCVAAYRNNSYSSFLCCTPFGDIYVYRLQHCE